MKSITIHSLDDAVDALIREKARAEGTSLNKTIKKLLEEALGIRPKKHSGHRQDFMDLFGSWTKADAHVFAEEIKDLRSVDLKDWQ